MKKYFLLVYIRAAEVEIFLRNLLIVEERMVFRYNNQQFVPINIAVGIF